MYSYDVHGNVDRMYQFNFDIVDASQQHKEIKYEYDLVSGKVNKVIYQEGKQDQLIHKYSYDADNRLTDVYTSRNDVFYDRDASYFYYKHGPLTRMELGENNVQGVDYTYTIHGWIKAVNATNLSPTRDMGKDGKPGSAHQYFGRDVYSYTLHYFEDDYKNISNDESFIGDVSAITYNGLFNGNIAMMQTTLKNNGLSTIPVLSKYGYDQLNRLASANYNVDLDLPTNAWANSFDNRYKNEFTYDANGNILTQFRNGEYSNLGMDDLEYHYIAGSNKLDYVDDAASSTYTDDIDDQFAANYVYDEIGNLTYDRGEEINDIKWSVYGKVLEVDRFVGTRPFLYFSYGPGGQRITKRVASQGGPGINYYYFHDASGNIMGIYKFEEDTMYLEEQMIYGSSRIGSLKLHELLPDTTVTDSNLFVQKRGQKRYELSNHLGNVLTVLTDRRKLNCDSSWYDADITSVNDYSVFGVELKGRSWNTGESGRFGFNGKEKLNEAYGEGNAYDFGARIYDPRISRWLSCDPKEEMYPSLSPYSAFANNPLYFIDPGGETLKVAVEDQAKFKEDIDVVFGTGYFSQNLTFDENGYLQYQSTSGGAISEMVFGLMGDYDKMIASQVVTKAITSSDVIQVVYVTVAQTMVNPETGEKYKQGGKYIKDEAVGSYGGEATITLLAAKRGGLSDVTQSTTFVVEDPMHNGEARATLTFHGMGHCLFPYNDEQENVISTENIVRRILGYTERKVTDLDARAHINTLDPDKERQKRADFDKFASEQNNSNKSINLEKQVKESTKLN